MLFGMANTQKGKNMKIKVENYIIEPATFVAGTRGSYGIEKMELAFSREWEGLAVTVSFYPPDSEGVSVVYTGEPIFIPAEVMAKPGSSRMVVSGCLGDKTLITAEALVRVLNTSVPADSPALQPTPSVYEQVMSAIAGKAEASHGHNGIYAPASGRCEGLTVGYAENLLLSSEQSVENYICGTPLHEGVSASEATVQSVEGVTVIQNVENGNFATLDGWSQNDGSLAVSESGAEFKAASYSPARLAETGVINVAQGRKAYIYGEGQFLSASANKTGVVSLTSGADRLEISGTAIGAVRITLERCSYDAEAEEVGELISTEEYIVNVCRRNASTPDNIPALRTSASVIQGHKYYIGARIKTPLAADGFKLCLAANGGCEFEAEQTADWQTVSGITPYLDTDYAEISVEDKRVASAEISEVSGVDNVTVGSLDAFVRRIAAPCGGGRRISFTFLYSQSGWEITADSGETLTLSPSAIAEAGVDISGTPSAGARFKAEYIFPFAFDASATVSVSGNCGLENVSLDMDKYIAALGLIPQSGRRYIRFLGDGWNTPPYGITGTYTGEPEEGATVTVNLTVSSSPLLVKWVQMCDLTALGLEELTKEQLDALFASYTEQGGVFCSEVGGIGCFGVDGEAVGGCAEFGENYRLCRLPDGTRDILSVSEGKLYRYVASQYISGEAEEWISLDDAAENSPYILSSGESGALDGNELMLENEIYDVEIFYKLAEPRIEDISEPDKFSVSGGGLLYTLAKRESGVYEKSPTGGYFKIGMLSNTADVIDKNRLVIEALLAALGVELQQGDSVETLSQKLSEALFG